MIHDSRSKGYSPTTQKNIGRTYDGPENAKKIDLADEGDDPRPRS